MKTKFNFKDVVTPKAGLVVYTDSYWMCESGNPKKALFYGDSPQCNKNKTICENSSDNKIYKKMGVEVVFIPVAYVPSRN